MNEFEIYLLKSTISIIVLYSFYWILLRNETFYSLNRWFLVLTLSGSLIVPIFSFSRFVEPNSTISNIIEPVFVVGVPIADSGINPINFRSILALIYICGASFFVLRSLLSFVKLYSMYFHLPKFRKNGFTVVILNEDRSPFSFFNILFLSEKDFSDDSINEMLVHEQAHRDGWHSIDCILLEIATIMQWFNPVMWLFRRSLIADHEFLADKSVLNKGYEKVKYQKLLFDKTIGSTALNLTSNFNSSLLKKRLKMMTMNNSNANARFKYLLALPLLIAIMSFTIAIDSFGQKDKIYDNADVMALYQGVDIGNARKFIAQNVMYPQSARKNKVAAKVYVQFVIDKNGQLKDAQVLRSDIIDDAEDEVVVVGYEDNKNADQVAASVKDLEKEALRVVNMLDGFTPAEKDGKKVSTQYTFPINFILTKKDS